MNKYFGLIGTLLLPICVSTAEARTIGLAEARLSLFLDTPTDGVEFTISSFLPDSSLPVSETKQGLNSSALVSNGSQTGVEPFNRGDEVSANVVAASSANGPFGISNGFIQSGVALKATNKKASNLSLSFRLDVELSSSVQATESSLEYSLATADVFATITDVGVTTSLFQASIEADTDFGPLDDDAQLTLFPFSLTLPSGTSQTIGLIALAQVESASLVEAPPTVPLPPALFLLLKGLVLLPIIRISKRFLGRSSVTSTDCFRTHWQASEKFGIDRNLKR